MKITIVGTGYVGLVSGACFAEMGIEVTCVDIDTDKIAKLQQGQMPIYEPGLSELVVRNSNAARLHFTSDLASALTDAEVVFIAVGTPEGEDGSADLRYVLGVAGEIGQAVGSGAYLRSLRRTRSGGFTAENGYDLNFFMEKLAECETK